MCCHYTKNSPQVIIINVQSLEHISFCASHCQMLLVCLKNKCRLLLFSIILPVYALIYTWQQLCFLTSTNLVCRQFNFNLYFSHNNYQQNLSHQIAACVKKKTEAGKIDLVGKLQYLHTKEYINLERLQASTNRFLLSKILRWLAQTEY